MSNQSENLTYYNTNVQSFTDVTTDKVRAFIDELNNFQMEEYWITEDVRPDRKNEQWLNVILRKSN